MTISHRLVGQKVFDNGKKLRLTFEVVESPGTRTNLILSKESVDELQIMLDIARAMMNGKPGPVPADMQEDLSVAINDFRPDYT